MHTTLPTTIRNAHQVLQDQPNFFDNAHTALKGIVAIDASIDDLEGDECVDVAEGVVLYYLELIQSLRARLWAYWIKCITV